jgi:nucleoside-diphosphate-sugar epimerase
VKQVIGITGTKGWIGSYVFRYFDAHESFKVRSLDPWTKLHKENDNPKKMPKVDWVLHLAASTSITASYENPISVYRNNLNATISALSSCVRSSGNFIYMSAYVYGKPRYSPIDEKHPIDTTNPYMSTKWLSEVICQDVCKHLDVNLLILRTFNIYAPGVRKGRLISESVESCRSQRSIKLKDPVPYRDYLYVKDFCALLELILKEGIRPFELYNLAYGQSHSNLEVAKMIKRIMASPLEIKVENLPRKNDVVNIYADSTKIRKRFKWKPIYDLEAGLTDMLKTSDQ